jgi:uncharacterized protein YqeY
MFLATQERGSRHLGTGRTALRPKLRAGQIRVLIGERSRGVKSSTKNPKTILFQPLNNLQFDAVCARLLAFQQLGEGGMLRRRISDALKAAMLAREARTVSTVRLILAALKDRDIAARGRGVTDGVGDDEILQMLQSMVKQRRESIALYEQGGRLELAQGEAEEIAIIERFLPTPLSETEMAEAVAAAIAEIDAHGLKDMGRTMAVLKERYAGQMDFTKASALVKGRLG